MNINDLYLDQDQSTYSFNMICIYIAVLIVAFILCVIISQKLKVYNTSYKKEIKSKFNTKFNGGNQSQTQALEEMAATAQDSKGDKDKR